MTDDPSTPRDSPSSGHAPDRSRVASLFAQALAFVCCLLVGLVGQLVAYVWLALQYEHGNSPYAGVLVKVSILAYPALSLAVLGLLVRKHRRAKQSGELVNGLAAAALLGLAISTMLLGLCAGVMLTGSLLSP